MLRHVEMKIMKTWTLLEVIAHIAVIFTIISMATGMWESNMP